MLGPLSYWFSDMENLCMSVLCGVAAHIVVSFPRVYVVLNDEKINERKKKGTRGRGQEVHLPYTGCLADTDHDSLIVSVLYEGSTLQAS